MSIVSFREQMAEPRTLDALEDAGDLKAAIKARKEKGAVSFEEIKAELNIGTTKASKRSK